MKFKRISVSGKDNSLLAVCENSSILLPIDAVKKRCNVPNPPYSSICVQLARILYELLGGSKDSMMLKCIPTANGFIVFFKPNQN